MCRVVLDECRPRGDVRPPLLPPHVGVGVAEQAEAEAVVPPGVAFVAAYPCDAEAGEVAVAACDCVGVGEVSEAYGVDAQDAGPACGCHAALAWCDAGSDGDGGADVAVRNAGCYCGEACSAVGDEQFVGVDGDAQAWPAAGPRGRGGRDVHASSRWSSGPHRMWRPGCPAATRSWLRSSGRSLTRPVSASITMTPLHAWQ